MELSVQQHQWVHAMFEHSDYCQQELLVHGFCLPNLDNYRQKESEIHVDNKIRSQNCMNLTSIIPK
jgi:hypothetical protein